MSPATTKTEINTTTPRVVRISVTDGDSTESSGNDEDKDKSIRCCKVKKHMNEIRIEVFSNKSMDENR